MGDLRENKELMADFNACMKYRRQHISDLEQFAMAKKYSVRFITKMQSLGWYSLMIWAPLMMYFYSLEIYTWDEVYPWFLVHSLVSLQWDNYWAEGFLGHTHFDYFSREELQHAFGDQKEDDLGECT